MLAIEASFLWMIIIILMVYFDWLFKIVVENT